MMCPIMKNNFDIYQPSAAGSPVTSGGGSGAGSQPRSRKTSQCSNRSGTKWSHAMSPSGTSGPTSLSSSPGSDLDERLRAVASVGGPAETFQSSRSRRISRCSEHGTAATCANVVPQSVSSSSLNKFHMRLVDKLRRALRSKDDSALKSGGSST